MTQIPSKSEELLEWLNEKSNSRLKSITEARSGREIAFALVMVSKLSQFAQKIQFGSRISEQIENFSIVKEVFEALKLPFKFDVESMISGNERELAELISVIKMIDSAHKHPGIDDFLNELEDDLEGKLENLNRLKEKLDEHAKERDFYFQKLLEIERDAANYPKADVETILNALAAPSVEFLPN